MLPVESRVLVNEDGAVAMLAHWEGAVRKQQHIRPDEVLIGNCQEEFGRKIRSLKANPDQDAVNYHYSGRDHIAEDFLPCSLGWAQAALDVTNHLGFLKCAPRDCKPYNHILVNYYEAGDQLAWHRDDEPDLVGPIFNFSFGANATFEIEKGKRGRKSITLRHGDMLVGNQKFFQNWYHRICPVQGPRLSYTLRTVKGYS